jgi:tetratricopeptide (TPR) repeat protein
MRHGISFFQFTGKEFFFFRLLRPRSLAKVAQEWADLLKKNPVAAATLPRKQPGETAMIDQHTHKVLLAAEGYLELGLLGDALREVQSLSEQEQMSVEGLSALLEIYRAAEDWSLMEAVAASLWRTDKQKVEHWLDLAFAKRHASSVESARELLAEAAKRFPSEAMVHFQLACCECQLGNLASAKEHLGESKRLCATCRVLALTDEGDLNPFWLDYVTPWAV